MACCCDWGNPHPKSVAIGGTKYKILEVMGEGGYGFVYRAKDVSRGKGKNKPNSGINGEGNAAIVSNQQQRDSSHSRSAQDALAETLNSDIMPPPIDESGEVALKRFLLTDGASTDERVRVLAEVEHHRMASASGNRNIVRFIGSEIHHTRNSTENDQTSSATASEVWVAMSLCRGGSLQDAVNYNLKHGGEFDTNELFSIVSQCAAAVRHLHSGKAAAAAGGVPMSHWDLKLDNLLLVSPIIRRTAEGQPGMRSTHSVTSNSIATSSFWARDTGSVVQLCDFGASSLHALNPRTARQVAEADAWLDSVMTLAYRAPETVDLWETKRHNGSLVGESEDALATSHPSYRLQRAVGTQADIWALGVVYYALLYQEMPFEDTRQSVLSAVPKWTAPIPMWTRLDTKVNVRARLLDLVLNRMLVKDPQQRADIHEVERQLLALSKDIGAEVGLDIFTGDLGRNSEPQLTPPAQPFRF